MIINREKNEILYNSLISKLPEIERKGKANPYTSLNGHMFSFLDKEGKLGIRMSEDDKAAFENKYNSPPFIQYNAVMRGYVTVPQELLENTSELLPYIKKSIVFIKSLKPKPTSKKK
ncbi:MAG: hypothetical protein KJP21_01420 [Bacteroidia bacterium]|nr:hypothetical protein [Bacteroidia bacterium]NNJ55887.1 hypothetical protein [Bacteroidia bacterium]